MLRITFFLISCVFAIIYCHKCVPRSFDEDSIVCVCNATYCDFTKVNIPCKGKFNTYVTSKSGQRFYEEIGEFKNDTENNLILELNVTIKYQTIHGFGGAFTDSAGININTLSNATQQYLLRSYFKPEGSNYNLCRVPVGGTDFSTRPYTLDDHEGDIRLSKFALTQEDTNYKIPFMKMALKMNSKLKFFAAAWTAPPWMKKNNDYNGFLGVLRKEYYQTYADYLVKFLETYKTQGLPMWAISTGNEPENAFIPFVPINDMGWTPYSVSDWVVNNLGPTIVNSSSKDTLILALDDNRHELPWYINFMYRKNPEIDKYIAGIALHWYSDKIFPIILLDLTHKSYPEKFMLMTEASTGVLPWSEHVRLGNWERGEEYIRSIIQDLNHWVSGWIDWNLALDKTGGPSWVNNNIDSPIIVSSETDEFFKQPMYYAIAHFSKFIPRGSVRVALTQKLDIESVAFITPDNAIVIVLYNRGNALKNVAISDQNQGNIIIEIPAKSIMTIIYRQ